ncbi:uncharacterized protein LOC129738520 [Uranotaenia lowii]|uniref:uncharacterized protein LOC129738520 n=1 Tax=Uranotaenia lowii TaxID=190385 RepID=UPI002479CF53|nr:uncharacterized protein LOC129738520 [Uranotaenia lowii]
MPSSRPASRDFINFSPKVWCKICKPGNINRKTSETRRLHIEEMPAENLPRCGKIFHSSNEINLVRPAGSARLVVFKTPSTSPVGLSQLACRIFQKKRSFAMKPVGSQPASHFSHRECIKMALHCQLPFQEDKV